MLPEWWYQMTGAEKLGTSVGLMAVLVAAATIYLVWRQISIMRRQTEMMREQTEISRRQEEIAKRQGEIAEKQHQIVTEEMARRPELHVRVDRGEDEDGPYYMLILDNQGQKEANGVSVILIYLKALDSLFTMQTTRTATKGVERRSWGEAIIVSDFLTTPVFVNRPKVLAKIRPSSEEAKNVIWFHWRLICKEGEFPPQMEGESTVLGKVDLNEVQS